MADLLELGAPPSRTDHTELFVLELPPYASIYLGEEGWMGGRARRIIAGFWRAVGRRPPDEPDHLAALLALYSELAEEVDGEPDRRAVARSTMAKEARRALFEEHLAPWVFVYLREVEAVSGSKVYRAWAETLYHYLLGELAELGRASRRAVHLRQTASVPDPRGERGGDDFLAALLTPVRSGAIVTRSGLRRVAAGRLGMRAGERLYALRHLVAQDACATFERLAGYYEAAGELHDALAPLAGATASELGRRSRHTAALLEDMARSTTGESG